MLQRVDAYVKEYLPQGTERNARWYVGDFDGGEGESANVNLRTGQWIDNGGTSDDVGNDLISLHARIRGLNNGQAARELMDWLGWRQVDDPPLTRASAAAAQTPAVPPGDGADAAVAEHAPAEPARRAERWKSVHPAPRFARPPKQFRMGFKNKATGQWEDHEAVRTWDYVFEGELYGYAARFERINSKGELVKDVMPLTWCEDTHDPRGSYSWHWKQWTPPRPLYVPATLLSADLALPVVVVEGEKCAQAGHQLLGHEFDFVSWPGGGKAWPLAHWGWIAGRQVILWPDADAQHHGLSKLEREQGVDPNTKPLKPLVKQPGYATMVGIAGELLRNQACTVRMVAMKEPGERPDGWDLADAIAEGWTADDVRTFIRAARPFVPPEPAVSAAAGKSTPSMAGAGPVVDAPADGAPSPNAWLAYLMTSGTGAVQRVRENVILALDGRPDKRVAGIADCDGLIRFNEFTNNVEKARPTPWGTPPGDWMEHDELQLGDWLVREHGMPSMSREALIEAVMVVARRHTFHPLRERMLSRRGQWDSTPRLDMWLERVCLEEDEHPQPLQEYLRLAGRFFVMAMCARVMPEVRRGSEVLIGPGCKFDYMLVLEGPQGWGKSTLAAVLGGDYYADTGLDVQHKDSLMNIQGVAVYEWSELESLTKQEVGDVKRFISSPTDRFRATFDKRPAKYPRQVVFVGTTNEAHYLIDTTGNRRFWPVRLTRPPDLQWLRDNLEQLLAEAVHRVDAGEPFYPNRTQEATYFRPQQQARQVEGSLESAVRTYLYDEKQKVPHLQTNGTLVNEVTMQDLLTRLGYSIDKQTDAVVKKAGGVMHMLGWTTRRLSPDEEGKRPRVYVRPRDAYKPAAGGQPTAGAVEGAQRDGRADGHSPSEDPDGPPF